MNLKAIFSSLLLFVSILLSCKPGFCDEPYTVPTLGQPPITWDGGNMIEGTSVATPLSLHGRASVLTRMGLGLADNASQLIGAVSLGLGLPFGFETAVYFPVGITFASPNEDYVYGVEPPLEGLGEDGGAIGDVTAALVWSAFDATRGGLGLLFGVKGSAPSGNHDRLMGEGDFTLEPFTSIAFQVLGSRLSFNLGYRIRPEHISSIGGRTFEQDDDLIWRVGLRIPKKFDIAWSIEAEGTIGMATDEGIWPSYESRPVLIGAGVDFPVERRYRFGTFGAVGIVGEAAPIFTIGFSFSWLPVQSDEDEDGVGGRDDECPLLKEDVDGYKDKDGCPDLDNDSDGFPDNEDKCPLEPAGTFSEDGC